VNPDPTPYRDLNEVLGELVGGVRSILEEGKVSSKAMAVSFILLLLVPVVSAAGTAVPAAKEGKAFRFSVMGDNRPRGEGGDVVTQPAEFLQTIREVNLLRPDLAVVVGDLIMGYTGDKELIRKEWDAFDEAVRGFTMPVRLVPGNHDIWDRQSKEIYRKRYGPSYYSFQHEGCRFIVLDSEDIVHRDRITGAQLEWLEAELAKKARQTFVFLHKPFWRYDEGGSNWNEDVHPLLTAAGVTAVFAGHWHYYEKSRTRDGVAYYVTGGAGAEIDENEHAGDFFHHLLVDVPAKDDDPITVHVLRTGFLHDDSLVTEEIRQTARDLTKALIPTGVRVEEGVDADSMVRIEVENPYDAPLLVRHALDAAESGAWTMEPDRSAVLLPPGERTTIRLRFSCPAEEFFPGPAISLTGVRNGRTVLKSTSRVAVRFDRKLSIPLAAEPVELDGKLDDAAWAAGSPAGRFLRIDGSGYAKAPTEFRACRDAEALYLSFRCELPGADKLEGKLTERDWSGFSEECLIFYLDPVRDGKSRFCMGVTAFGIPIDYRAPGGVVDRAWNPEWGRAVSRDENGWTLEVRIPFALIGMTPGAGAELGVNAFRFTTTGGQEFSGWSIPVGGRLFTPAGFGTAVLE